MPEGAVYVGRPTVFGNYHSGSRWDDDDWPLGCFPTWQEYVVECYRRWLLDEPEFMVWWRGTIWGCCEQMAGDPARAKVLARLPELRGKDLACWCRLVSADAYVPCHADVLLSLANNVSLEDVQRENFRLATGKKMLRG